MAQGLTIKLKDEKALRRRLDRLAGVVDSKVRFCVNRSALNIQRIAKRRLTVQKSVDTGRLRSSIRIDFLQNGLAADIATDVEYADFVEFGTKPHTIEAKNKQALFWKGAEHPVKSVEHPGSPPKPFMFPAWEEEVPKFIACLERDIKKAVS